MPAHTAAQLQDILGTGEYSYFAPRGSFLGALRQVYPRLVDMGLWRDMAYEVSLSGALGYVSLPADTDAVLACTINDFARNTRSQWHDVRIVGRQATVSAYFGIVDDGFHPVLLDMKDVQGVATEADVVSPPDGFLAIRDSGTTTETTDTALAGGVIKITVQLIDGGSEVLTQGAPDSDVLFSSANDFNKILSISYDDVPLAVDLVDPAFPTKIIATIPAGSGVLRFRRFRTSGKAPDATVHLLVKRGAPSHITADTIIHLGNIGALKHGLLGLIAEDKADLERANFHWGMAGKLLDQELASMFGSAKPTLRMHDVAAGGVYNLY